MKIKINFNVFSWFKKLSLSFIINAIFIISLICFILFMLYLIRSNIKAENITKKVKPIEKNFINEVSIYSNILYNDSVTLNIIKYDIYVDNKIFKTKTIIDTLPPYFIDEYRNKIKYKYHMNLDNSSEIK